LIFSIAYVDVMDDWHNWLALAGNRQDHNNLKISKHRGRIWKIAPNLEQLLLADGTGSKRAQGNNS